VSETRPLRASVAASVQVRRVDYHHPADRAALELLLNHYAQDPMGGGAAIAPEALARLCDELAQRPFAFSFIAWRGGEPVGLINCFEGFSTFKAKPLVNVHDVVVHETARGQGVGQALLDAAEGEARARGACKLTLEVLSTNTRALKSYEHFGFAHYQLGDAAGHALFMQKWLL
jgi:ribosomal protein S18 acetylase RimI-like enzyme